MSMHREYYLDKSIKGVCVTEIDSYTITFRLVPLSVGIFQYRVMST